MKVGYARVSTVDQSLNLQLDALQAAGCDVVFDDVLSGKTRKRPGLERALAFVGPGDQLLVWRLDRLGRRFLDLVNIGDELQKRGADLVSLTEGIDTSSSVGQLVFHLLGVLSQFEREVTVERTLAGLQAARSRGVKLGRKPKLSLSEAEAAKALMGTGMKADLVAAKYNIGRATLFRALAMHGRQSSSLLS